MWISIIYFQQNHYHYKLNLVPTSAYKEDQLRNCIFCNTFSLDIHTWIWFKLFKTFHECIILAKTVDKLSCGIILLSSLIKDINGQQNNPYKLTSSICRKILFRRLRILSCISCSSILAKSCTVSGPSIMQNLHSKSQNKYITSFPCNTTKKWGSFLFGVICNPQEKVVKTNCYWVMRILKTVGKLLSKVLLTMHPFISIVGITCSFLIPNRHAHFKYWYPLYVPLAVQSQALIEKEYCTQSHAAWDSSSGWYIEFSQIFNKMYYTFWDE